MFTVDDKMLKQVAAELDWPEEEVKELVQRAMKSETAPDSLEALKSALTADKAEKAVDDLLSALDDQTKAMLKARLAPAEDETSKAEDEEEDAGLKAIEELKAEVAQTNAVVRALAEAMAVKSEPGNIQDALQEFLAKLPKQEAAQFGVTKSGVDQPTLEAIQQQLNEMQAKMDAGPTNTQFHYDAFTSKRLNREVPNA